MSWPSDRLRARDRATADRPSAWATVSAPGRAWGDRIRRQRRRRGWSLAELARRTRIRQEYLAALEDGRIEDLPSGPYAQAFLREVRRHLAVSDDLDIDSWRGGAAAPRGVRLGVVRGMALVSVIALVGLLASLVWQRLWAGEPVALGSAIDQQITVSARRDTRVRAVVDGELAIDGIVAEGDQVQLQGADRIEIDLDAAEHVRIVWNGQTVVPQGLQDTRRRLVFVDDAGMLP